MSKPPTALSLVLLLAAAWSPASAQSSSHDAEAYRAAWPSHEEVPDDRLGLEPGQLLLSRLAWARGRAEAQGGYLQLLKDLRSSHNKEAVLKVLQDKQAELMEVAKGVKNGQLKLDKADPMLQQLVNYFRQHPNDPDLKAAIPPDLRRVVEDNIRGQPSDTDTGSNPTSNTGSGNSQIGPSGISGPLNPSSDQTGSLDNLAGQAAGPNAANGESFDVSKWALKQMQSLISREGMLSHSEAIRQAMDEFNRSRLSQNAAGGEPDTWNTRLTHMVIRAVPRDLLNRVRVPSAGELGLPSLGDLRLPDLLPRVRLRSSNPGSDARPAPVVTSPSSRGLLIAAALLVFLVFWLIAGRIQWDRASPAKTRQSATIDPARWPVAPEALQTAHDIVRAFEYLTLVRFGQRARSWNHRAIAARLAAEHAEYGSAPAQVASLYERIRYAPESVPLSEHDLAVARRSLQLMAGGAGE